MAHLQVVVPQARRVTAVAGAQLCLDSLAWTTMTVRATCSVPVRQGVVWSGVGDWGAGAAACPVYPTWWSICIFLPTCHIASDSRSVGRGLALAAAYPVVWCDESHGMDLSLVSLAVEFDVIGVNGVERFER